MKAFQIPVASRIAKGVPLPQILPIDNNEKISSVIPVTTFGASNKKNKRVTGDAAATADSTDIHVSTTDVALVSVSSRTTTAAAAAKTEYLLLLTSKGFIKRTPLNAFGSISSRGLTVLSLTEHDSLRWARICTDDDEVIVATR